MKAGRALSQLTENFRRLNRISKICKGTLEWISFRPGLTDHAGEDCAHRVHVRAQLGEQCFSRSKAETTGEDLERFASLRDSVSLLFGFDLKPMFNSAEETISFLQLLRIVVRQKFQLCQAANRLQ